MREINLEIRKIKEKERKDRETEWKKANRYRKNFTGEVGDLCIVRTKFQNKSKGLFSTEVWKIVQKFRYTALLSRVSDNLTQVRSGKEIKVIFSPSKDQKLPKELIERFDLVSYDRDTLASQEELLVEPRSTRSKNLYKNKHELSLEEKDDESGNEFDIMDDAEFLIRGGPPKVGFDEKVRTKYITNIMVE